MRCERCLQKADVTTGSYFDTSMICTACETEEKAHPDYAKAKAAEALEVSKGNLNFQGIGWPGKDGRVG